LIETVLKRWEEIRVTLSFGIETVQDTINSVLEGFLSYLHIAKNLMFSPQKGKRGGLSADRSRSLVKAQSKKPEKWMPPPSLLGRKQQQLMHAL